MIEKKSEIEETAKKYGLKIGSLRDLIEGIESVCEAWKKKGVAGVKLSQSYFRRMDFHRRDQSDAKAVMRDILNGDIVPLLSERGKVLGDFLVFECCRIASDLDLTIQFHLGLRAKTYGSLEGCSPAPMVELFESYKNARFDLSHSGFPYLFETAVLAKGWSNIYLNMDWIQAVSPEGSKRALKEWIRMVPYNKLIAFGDDVAHVETAYGALVIARRNVASVLAELIEEGILSESDSLDIARSMFHDTPAALYGVA
jgi:predicted TIM-barrel fold metal-dependent hydrolase